MLTEVYNQIESKEISSSKIDNRIHMDQFHLEKST